MKILLIAAIILSTTTVFAQEDLSAPTGEKTKCSLGRKAASEKTKSADDKKDESQGSIQG
ncbi:MAG: hypothetical protein ACOYL6_05290 [Bacteriovoracaceae bacterium]